MDSGPAARNRLRPPYPRPARGCDHARHDELSPYPAFRGWSWAANWWVDKLGADAAAGAEEGKTSALEKATATGSWSAVLDAVSDRVLGQAVQAEKQFRATCRRSLAGKLSVMTGPYRAVGRHPPVTFRNADEVDLHYQAEQIQPRGHAAQGRLLQAARQRAPGATPKSGTTTGRAG